MDEGKHEDLLARGGHLADLYRLQFEDGKTVLPTGARPGKRLRRKSGGLKRH